MTLYLDYLKYEIQRQGRLAFGACVRARWGPPVQTAGYWLAHLMLIVLELYLLVVLRGLNRLEAAGQRVWR